MQVLNGIEWIGAAVGSGSHDRGTRNAPYVLKDYLDLRIIEESPSGHRLQALSGLVDFNQRLAAATKNSKQQDRLPVVIGGDHSCAIGTWSGIASHVGAPIGLLWVDAHMDSHTIDSTESGNIHGMPLAALLGKGSKHLSQIASPSPKLNSKHTVLFGVRSYEHAEAALLQSLGVRVYTMKEIKERGFEKCWHEAVWRVSRAPHGFGLSLDLDALDPQYISGVGTPVPGGLSSDILLRHLQSLFRNHDLLGVEIAEFNPLHDEDNESLSFVLQLALDILRSSQASEYSHDPILIA